MSTAATAQDQSPPPAASDDNTWLPFRGDTLLGVCEAVGQDLGVHPNWLRIPFAALILWNPEIVIAVYLSLGVVVAATRWFFPARRSTAAAPKLVSETAPVSAERKDEDLAFAA